MKEIHHEEIRYSPRVTPDYLVLMKAGVMCDGEQIIYFTDSYDPFRLHRTIQCRIESHFLLTLQLCTKADIISRKNSELGGLKFFFLTLGGHTSGNAEHAFPLSRLPSQEESKPFPYKWILVIFPLFL